MKGPVVFDADKMGELSPIQLRKMLADEHGFDIDHDVPLASRRYWKKDAKMFVIEYTQH